MGCSQSRGKTGTVFPITQNRSLQSCSQSPPTNTTTRTETQTSQDSTDQGPRPLSSILSACKFGRLNTVKQLIEQHGASEVLGYRGMFDNSPLLVACQYEQWKVAKFLLGYKPSLTHYNEKHCNPMIYTCLLGDCDDAYSLLQQMMEQLNDMDNLFELFRTGDVHVPFIDGYRTISALAGAILNSDSTMLKILLGYKNGIIPRCNDSGSLWFTGGSSNKGKLKASIQTSHPLILAATLRRWEHYLLLLDSWLCWFLSKSPKHTPDILSCTVTTSNCPWIPPNTNLVHVCCGAQQCGIFLETIFVIVFSRCVYDRTLPCSEDSFHFVVREVSSTLLRQLLALEEIATICIADIRADSDFRLDPLWIRAFVRNLLCVGDFFSRNSLELLFPGVAVQHIGEKGIQLMESYEANFHRCFGYNCLDEEGCEFLVDAQRISFPKIFDEDSISFGLSSTKIHGCIYQYPSNECSQPSKKILADAGLTLQHLLECLVAFPNTERGLLTIKTEEEEAPVQLLCSRWVLYWINLAILDPEEPVIQGVREHCHIPREMVFNFLTDSSFDTARRVGLSHKSSRVSEPSHYIDDILSFQLSEGGHTIVSNRPRGRSRSAEIGHAEYLRIKKKRRRYSYVSEPEDIDRKVYNNDFASVSWDISTRESVTTARQPEMSLRKFISQDESVDLRNDYLSPMNSNQHRNGFFRTPTGLENSNHGFFTTAREHDPCSKTGSFRSEFEQTTTEERSQRIPKPSSFRSEHHRKDHFSHAHNISAKGIHDSENQNEGSFSSSSSSDVERYSEQMDIVQGENRMSSRSLELTKT